MKAQENHIFLNLFSYKCGCFYVEKFNLIVEIFNVKFNGNSKHL